jgi:hypothetical protein
MGRNGFRGKSDNGNFDESKCGLDDFSIVSSEEYGNGGY